MSHQTVAASAHGQLYRARPSAPELVDVPEATFLMIDGHGDPNTSERFALGVQALYSAAYTIKFALKKATGRNERVAPLEGLWWGAEAENFAAATKDAWSWTLMIRLPDGVPPDLVADSLNAAAAKKPGIPLGEVRVERFAEGRAAQVMHLGPYAEEQPTIAALHKFIDEQNCRLRGKHHEIYLGDPRRAAPAKLKTLIRQPVDQ
ncbi:MAG TPA: GyrI-like domain-containing protein [Acidimicrobiales bacterium]|nr:GyrI-like domain-containing protein [Acidimicrobiales bacterium]